MVVLNIRPDRLAEDWVKAEDAEPLVGRNQRGRKEASRVAKDDWGAARTSRAQTGRRGIAIELEVSKLINTVYPGT